MIESGTRRGVGLVWLACWLRLLFVPASYFVPTELERLMERSTVLARLLGFLPLTATLLALAGYLVLSRGERASSMWAQLTCAAMGTEVLFDLVLLVAPQRLTGLPALVYVIEALWIAMLLTGWQTLRTLAEELESHLPTLLGALFYFGVAMRAGLYGARAFFATTRPTELSPAGITSAVAFAIALALPLLQAIASGQIRRALVGKNGRPVS